MTRINSSDGFPSRSLNFFNASVAALFAATTIAAVARAELPRVGDIAIGMTVAEVRSAAQNAKTKDGKVPALAEPQLATNGYSLRDGRKFTLPNSEHVASQRITWGNNSSYTARFTSEPKQERVLAIKREEMFAPSKPTIDGLIAQLVSRYGPIAFGGPQMFGGLGRVGWSFDIKGSPRKFGAGNVHQTCDFTKAITGIPRGMTGALLLERCGDVALIAMFTDGGSDQGASVAGSLTLEMVSFAAVVAEDARLGKAIADDVARAQGEAKARDKQNLPDL